MLVVHLDDLNQVSARIVENSHANRSRVHWFHSEPDAKIAQSPIFRVEVVDAKRSGGDAIRNKSVLVGFSCRMATRFQQQFHSSGILFRYDGEPAIFAHRYVVLWDKAEDPGVEIQGLGLVVDQDACDIEFSWMFPS